MDPCRLQGRSKGCGKLMGVCRGLHVPPPLLLPESLILDCPAQHTLLWKVKKPGQETWQS